MSTSSSGSGLTGTGGTTHHHRPAFVHSSTSYTGNHTRPVTSSSTNQHSRQHSASPSRGTNTGSNGGKLYYEHREYQNQQFAYLPTSTNDDDDDNNNIGRSADGMEEDENDYPISKETYPPSDPSFAGTHYTQRDEPSRGLYGFRRTPSSLVEGESNRSPPNGATTNRWNRCGREGGKLGRCMMIGWVVTTGGFLLGLGFWRGELFQALDNLSKTLSSLGFQGHLIFGLLILITTIPPLPLYSTLIILSGYTFGAWEGFVVSYLASLAGAVGVFLVARGWLKDVITNCLSSSPTSMSLLNIIPANPHLLLLIRIAPYPYNLLNVILASSPSLTLRTYTTCTAVSLCKLILHTWIGAGIHDLSKTYGGHSHGTDDTQGEFVDGHWRNRPSSDGGDGGSDGDREDVKTMMTWVGIGLCIVLFFYLTHLAKTAVRKAQEEQAERERNGLGILGNEEETMRFLCHEDGQEEV
ncbi:hypothetical protein IAR55_007014 [Kwoniella newhampshirensis]|uniref:Golgi apparatus membrane protein TVP38 n=1 Tax=Kwoniella newhampshirensis TaxID=1651941 RepID=A0AAW0YST2_9TREE